MRIRAVLLCCFFLSGTAGLIYQVAWTRQFALLFGSSEQAIMMVLAAFLGGLGAGAMLAGSICSRVKKPILVYALLELIVALWALVIPWTLRLSEGFYVEIFGGQNLPQAGGPQATLFHLLVSFAILVVPTGCMGATLPFLAREAVKKTKDIGAITGLLYAVNTGGAVLGAPLAGFYLLPTFGLRRAVLVAIGMNLLVFAVALGLALRVPAQGTSPTKTSLQKPLRRRTGRILALLVIVSGAVSLLYEVLWTRLLSHLLGGSMIAFSTMLATFLAGIALGSGVASRFADTERRAGAGFTLAQLGIACSSVASYAAIEFLPRLLAQPRGSEYRLLGDAALAGAVLLPAALCIGATFPFAVRLLAHSAEETASASARVYGWSTLGSIVGALGTGLFLLPALGFGATLAVAVGANLVLALVAALLLEPRRLRFAILATLGLVTLICFPPSTPWKLLRTRPLDQQPIEGQVIYHGVGQSATVLLTESKGAWNLATNGMPEGSIQSPEAPMGGYLVTRWLGALATFIRPEGHSMMVIGLGAGEALEAIPATVDSIEVVELETEVFRANQRVASNRRHDPLADPRIRLVINDARSALLLSNKPFDAIVSQPSHPWTSGSAHLYTKEFFELAHRRLGARGVFVQWIGLPFVNGPLLKSLLATLGDVFPHVLVFRPPTGAALLFVASEEPFDLGQSIPQGLEAVSDLPELGIARAEDLVAALVLDEQGSRELGAGAPLITDDWNLLEARSQKVLAHSLARDRGEKILAPRDPIPMDPSFPMNRAYLIRRLLRVGETARALRLAESFADPATRQTGLALVARADGRGELARQLIQDALRQSPLSRESRGLALDLQRRQIMRGGSPFPQLQPLTLLERTVVSAWRLKGQGQTRQIESLESILATAQPGSPLYSEAVRLRAEWRLISGDPKQARYAAEILDPVLARGHTPEVLLLRAQATAIAENSGATLASISVLKRLIAHHPNRDVWVRRARKIMERLPESPSEIPPPIRGNSSLGVAPETSTPP